MRLFKLKVSFNALSYFWDSSLKETLAAKKSLDNPDALCYNSYSKRYRRLNSNDSLFH